MDAQSHVVVCGYLALVTMQQQHLLVVPCKNTLVNRSLRAVRCHLVSQPRHELDVLWLEPGQHLQSLHVFFDLRLGTQSTLWCPVTVVPSQPFGTQSNWCPVKLAHTQIGAQPLVHPTTHTPHRTFPCFCFLLGSHLIDLGRPSDDRRNPRVVGTPSQGQLCQAAVELLGQWTELVHCLELVPLLHQLAVTQALYT